MTADAPRTKTLDVLPQIAAAAAACSFVAIEFTIPQVVRLSQPTATPLPPAPLARRLAMAARMMPLQTAITGFQFAFIRELRDALDAALGPSPYNLSVSYGSTAWMMAAKYNLIIGGTYGYSGVSAPGGTAASAGAAAYSFWRRNVAPGLVWSFLRDCGSVGGGIVVAPVATPPLARLLRTDPDTHAPTKFAGGLGAGAACGLATQLFHNAALTAGRVAESTGEIPSAAAAMRTALAEHGARAVYVNFQFRVAIIALWTGILNVADPFRKAG